MKSERDVCAALLDCAHVGQPPTELEIDLGNDYHAFLSDLCSRTMRESIVDLLIAARLQASLERDQLRAQVERLRTLLAQVAALASADAVR